MIQEWERSEFEEVIGQFAHLALTVYNNPDDANSWSRLKALAEDHKSYIADSYNAPVEDKYEAKGYNVAELDGIDEHLNF